MARQSINVGSSANDGTGDPLRTAGQKIEANFIELYATPPGSTAADMHAGIPDAKIESTDPQSGKGASDRALLYCRAITTTYSTSPGFANFQNNFVVNDVTSGRYLYGNPNATVFHQNKETVLGYHVLVNGVGSAQTFSYSSFMNNWCMGDNAIHSHKLWYAGGPVAGDEGLGFTMEDSVYETNDIHNSGITGVTTGTVNTTATQAITASETAQTITVASTSGMSVGGWIVFNHHGPSAYHGMIATQIEAVGSGTVTCKIAATYPTGMTIKSAVVINTFGAPGYGEGRTVVNMTRPAITAGTVSSISGGSVTFSGTSFTTNMVGGTTECIGAISFTQDNITVGDGNGLTYWYLISGVTSATNLSVFTNSVAGDQSIVGRTKATSGGAYTIRPAARLLKRLADPNTHVLILEPNAMSWQNGDAILCSHCPYPDVHGMSLNFQGWSPGGTYRQGIGLTNRGMRTFETGFGVGSLMTTGGNADVYAWKTAFNAASSKVALNVSYCEKAITLPSFYGQHSNGNTSGRIEWAGGAYIEPNFGESGQPNGIMVQTCVSGSASPTLQFISGPRRSGGSSGSLHVMQWPGEVSFAGSNEGFGTLLAARTYPTSSTSTGKKGEMVMKGDSTKLAICIADNSWVFATVNTTP